MRRRINSVSRASRSVRAGVESVVRLGERVSVVFSRTGMVWDLRSRCRLFRVLLPPWAEGVWSLYFGMTLRLTARCDGSHADCLSPSPQALQPRFDRGLFVPGTLHENCRFLCRRSSLERNPSPQPRGSHSPHCRCAPSDDHLAQLQGSYFWTLCFLPHSASATLASVLLPPLRLQGFARH